MTWPAKSSTPAGEQFHRIDRRQPELVAQFLVERICPSARFDGTADYVEQNYTYFLYAMGARSRDHDRPAL